MTQIEPALRYPDISAQAFAHPGDRAAQAALHAVPMLDKVIKKLSEMQYENHLRQMLLGTAVRLGEDQMPSAWAIQRQCANTLDIERCPALYVTQQAIGQAVTIGTHEPVTLVMSGLISGFEEDELRSVLAHEMGHVLADHVGLTTTLQLTRAILHTVFRGQFLAALPLRALYYALLEWARMAELTADRASALVTGDPLLPCRTLMRVAGGPVKDLNLDAFIRQATEYAEEPNPFTRYRRFWTEIGVTHPFPVRRVRELIAWVSSGDYDRIRSGAYVRRGQEPPPSAEFDAAFAHYKQRFSTIVEHAGSGVATAFDKVTSWLDARGNNGGGPVDGDDDDDDEGFDADL
ncbi:MAG: M48 family metallopeptidase [Acidimicrobiales bacterium]|jgi:Zn-dependent protease with chaperone function